MMGRKRFALDQPLDSCRCLCQRLMLETVCLRRRRRVEEMWPRFREDVINHIDFLLEHLNSRWLVSIMDTFADYGDDIERRNAMCITLLMTWERMVAATRPREFRRRRMWDGLRTLATNRTADGHRHLFRRLNRQLAATPELHRVLQVLLARACKDPRFTLPRLTAISTRNLVKEVTRIVTP